MKKTIIIALFFLSLGMAQPVRAMHLAQPTPTEVKAMTNDEKKALIIKLMTLLIDLMKQLQALQTNQKLMTQEDIKVGSAPTVGSLDATPDFKINRFIVRSNGNVLIESLVELNIQATQFIVNDEVLPVKIDDVLGTKQGNYFVYETAITPNLYTISKQKEGSDNTGPAFALFTVKITSKDGRSLTSLEALQNKSGGYETSVQF